MTTAPARATAPPGRGGLPGALAASASPTAATGRTRT
jgi:hypothetical protein